MKKIQSLLCALLCVASSYSYGSESITPTLTTLSYEQIVLNEKTIADQMRKNKYVRIGLQAAIGVGVLATGGWLIKKHFFGVAAQQILQKEEDAEKLQSAVVDGEVINQKINKIYGLLHTYTLMPKNAVQKKPWTLPGFIEPFKDYSGWLINQAIVGFFTAQMIGTTNFATRPLFKVWDRVFHDGNVQWYITQKTHVKKFITELETLSEELFADQNDQQRTVTLNAIAQAEKGLIMELEKLIGFMNYKYNLYKKEYPFASNGMKMMTKNIVDEVGIFVTSVQDVLASPLRHVEMNKLIKNFHRKLNAHKRGFITYEEYPEESII